MTERQESILIKPKEFVPRGNQLSFKNFYIRYGKFHFDHKNVAIHILGIPILTWTGMALLRQNNKIKHISYGSGLSIGNHVDQKKRIDLIVVVWAILGIVYAKVEILVGFITWLCGYAGYRVLRNLMVQDKTKNIFKGHLLKAIKIVHVIAWIA